MLPLIATLLFLISLGIKLAIPLRDLIGLSMSLSVLFWLQLVNVLPVLVCLFIAAPLLGYITYRKWVRVLFVLCVITPGIFSMIMI